MESAYLDTTIFQLTHIEFLDNIKVGRAKRGGSGALYSKSALARLNSS